MSPLLRQILFVLTLCFSLCLGAQDGRKPTSNADIVSMKNSGLSEQTIILAIQQGPVSFDTSPQALIDLKRAGVSDAVIEAMLSAAKANAGPRSANSVVGTDPAFIIRKALNAVAPIEKLTAITTIRSVTTVTETRGGSTKTYEMERVTSYPDRIYTQFRNGGEPTEVVITSQFVYARKGNTRSTPPPNMVENYRTGMKFDPPYVAAHMNEFTFSYIGQEDVNGEMCDKVRLAHSSGKEEIWSISASGKTLRKSGISSSAEAYAIELSDFRNVEGVMVPFHRRMTSSGTSDAVVSVYQLNPPDYATNAALFNPPTQMSSGAETTGGLTVRVLEEKSVPYQQKIGGGPTTSCNISGGSTTNFSANSVGNYTYGNANTSTNLRLNCNSYDTTVNWQHVLNVMLVEASDGNAYVIGCDRAWRWSKCIPLRAGDTFAARLTGKGIEIQAVSSKGKELQPTYSILQSKSLR